MNRRDFLNTIGMGGLGLLSLSAFPAFAEDGALSDLFPVPTNTGIKGNIVVLGGGMAGATVAKYLRLWGGIDVNVTLVEKNKTSDGKPVYISNIMSNTVLTGQRDIANLHYFYDKLKSHYGVTLIDEEVKGIGISSIWYNDKILNFDRLVLAPGLQFDLMPGITSLKDYDDLVPHAWKAGIQTELLKDQLIKLRQYAPVTGRRDVVITIPKVPYRCPPGPYERACVIADWLKSNVPGGKVIVLDANPGIVVEKDNFEHAFNVVHAGVIDYYRNCTGIMVNPSSRDITFTGEKVGMTTATFYENLTISAGVLNPIPPQRAPDLLKYVAQGDPRDPNVSTKSLLNSPDGRFAAVNVLSYESTVLSNIHVIGDASFTTMPKAGHIGNQQAKTCADAILRKLDPNPNQNPDPDPAPVTNSACFTPITATTATWLSAVYQYNSTTKKMEIPSQHNSSNAIAATTATPENYQEMLTWFDTLMADTFA